MFNYLLGKKRTIINNIFKRHTDLESLIIFKISTIFKGLFQEEQLILNEYFLRNFWS